MHFCALIRIAHASAVITGIFHENMMTQIQAIGLTVQKLDSMDCGLDHGLKSGLSIG